MIQEPPYLQFFCGFSEYKYEPPFDPSLMVYFRKRLTPEILGELNELIIQKLQKKSEKDDDNDKHEPPHNKGTLIVDATCAPSQIKYLRRIPSYSTKQERIQNRLSLNCTTQPMGKTTHSSRTRT